MPAGNINTVDRIKRLNDMKKLIEENKTNAEIAEETGMSMPTVRRNRKYIEELSVSDLTPQDIGEKRSEIYLELLEASELAKQHYQDLLADRPSTAKNFFITWLKTIEMRMQLYGLDNVKSDNNLTQINNYIGVEKEKVNSDAAKRIRDSIIKDHEVKVKE